MAARPVFLRLPAYIIILLLLIAAGKLSADAIRGSVLYSGGSSSLAEERVASLSSIKQAAQHLVAGESFVVERELNVYSREVRLVDFIKGCQCISLRINGMDFTPGSQPILLESGTARLELTVNTSKRSGEQEISYALKMEGQGVASFIRDSIKVTVRPPFALSTNYVTISHDTDAELSVSSIVPFQQVQVVVSHPDAVIVTGVAEPKFDESTGLWTRDYRVSTVGGYPFDGRLTWIEFVTLNNEFDRSRVAVRLEQRDTVQLSPARLLLSSTSAVFVSRTVNIKLPHAPDSDNLPTAELSPHPAGTTVSIAPLSGRIWQATVTSDCRDTNDCTLVVRSRSAESRCLVSIIKLE